MLDRKFVERFHSKYVKHESGCWLWTASVAGRGYGQIKITGQRKQAYAHRLSYLIFKGIDPGDRQVCHTCDIPRCVNPDHLFIGTSQDNHDDMKNKGRSTYGESNPSAKLTEKHVLQIRAMLAAGVPQTRIAAVYGVAQMTVSRIATGDRWQNVK